METQSHLLKSLRIAWPITDQSRAYVCHILGKLGHRPAFDTPKYLQLWATATAGKLLNFDVCQWESDLEKEADRLEKINAEYEPTRRKLSQELLEAAARVKAAEEEVNQALSRRLGY